MSAEDKRNLFILGCPRSGTTGLTHLLNSHYEAVVGYESLAVVWDQQFELMVDGIFESPMFVDVLCQIGPLRTALSEPEWSVYNPSRQKAARMVADARVLGDKYPFYHRRIPELARRFPRAHFLAIFRDLYGVARSFAKRHDDPEDAWNLPHNRSAAYQNEALLDVVAAAHLGVPLTVVSYDEIFGGDVRYLERLLDRLGLGPNEDIYRSHRAQCERARRFKEDAKERPEVRAYAEEHADLALLEAVTSLSVL